MEIKLKSESKPTPNQVVAGCCQFSGANTGVLCSEEEDGKTALLFPQHRAPWELVVISSSSFSQHDGGQV